MAGLNVVTYAAAKSYTDQTVVGGGALKGKNCTVDSISDITGGHRVTFKWTLDNGTVQTGTMDVMDGADGQDGAPGAQGPAGPAGANGQDGADGLTPVITVEEITGGHRVTVTIGEETPEVFDVMDGTSGVGVPVGGTTGQVLKKKSDNDYDTEWGTGGGGGASTLAELDDTDINDPEEGQILVMNGDGDWENQDAPAIPTKTSDLTNDSNFVVDATYVHTDNNFDDTAEGKLSDLPGIKLIGSGLNLNASTGELTATGAAITIDDHIDSTSANPVQNQVIAAALDDKADTTDIPTKTSDLTNDSNFVVDASYVHTDNNYTTTEKDKLAGLVNYDDTALSGRVSDIEDVVPTDASASNKLATADDIPDVSNFITNTVNNLTNYYLKSETYTQAEVDALISAIVTLDIRVVSTLPVSDISRTTIYLVPKSTAQTQNVYDEYINTDGTASGWEKIGDTEIDLSDYVTDAELSAALADYTTTANLTTLLAAKQDTISDLADIRSGAAAGATAYQKPSTGVPKTDLASAVQTSLDNADSAYQKPVTGIPSTDLTSAAQTSLGLADSAYQKPSGGVPKTDLAQAVQNSLDKADGAGYWVSGQDKNITTSVTQVQFTVPNAGYGYEPYFESADGTPVYVQGESKSGTTLTYTIRALTSAQLPCKAKLLAIPVTSA